MNCLVYNLAPLYKVGMAHKVLPLALLAAALGVGFVRLLYWSVMTDMSNH
jgi:hypothetical protein